MNKLEPGTTVTRAHRLYFIRHGRSEGNLAKILQGQRDYDLTDRGRRQALSAAGWFKGKNVRRIITSPQTRAHETARILSEPRDGKSIIEWARINFVVANQ